MILRERDNYIEIVARERIPEHLPTPGDTSFSIRVQSDRFTGEGTTWIDWPTLQRFASDLAELDAKRAGRAEMESMSPGEFELTIKTTDGWGHTAISGRLASGKHTIEFEFDFENDRLRQLVSDFNEFARPVV